MKGQEEVLCVTCFLWAYNRDLSMGGELFGNDLSMEYFLLLNENGHPLIYLGRRFFATNNFEVFE